MSKNFDLDSNVKVGVTDIVSRPRGPRSRKEKLAERELAAAGPESPTRMEITPAPVSTKVEKPLVEAPVKPPEQRVITNEYSSNSHSPSTTVVKQSMSAPVSTHDEYSFEARTEQPEMVGIIPKAKSLQIHVQMRHLKVLNFLKQNLVRENTTRLLYHKQIEDATGIPTASVRRYLSELSALGVIISKQKAWANGFQGNYYSLNLSKIRDLMGMFDSIRNSAPDWDPRREQRTTSDRAMSTHDEYSLSTNSSNSRNLVKKTTTTDADHYDLSLLDLEEFPGLDLESIVQFRKNYPTLEAFQDFIDRVAYVVQKSRGAPSELKNPAGFLFKSLERRYVNVDSGFKSRAVRREEEELKASHAEVEEIRRIREEKRALELERARLRFEEWVDEVAQKRIDEFERERVRVYPATSGFDAPPSIRMKQLRQIQVDTFILEEGLPMTFREKLASSE